MNDELASLLQELESTTLEDYSMNSLLEETSNEVIKETPIVVKENHGVIKSKLSSVDDILKRGIEKGASDIHLVVHKSPVFRINGELIDDMEIPALSEKDCSSYGEELCNKEQWQTFESVGEIDLSYDIPNVSRFRVSIFKQRQGISIVIRIIPQTIPELSTLNLPNVLKDIIDNHQGLILVTGPTGSGKSTTMASMIQYLCQHRKKHIITLEDPIEYVYETTGSVINQREIGQDTQNFQNAFRASLRQDPDVILVGELRDFETISIALTAAETGHLVLGTLHTSSAASSVERIIDVFPSIQQDQVRTQLAGALVSVISQRLLPKRGNNGRVAVNEILINDKSVANLIRTGKTHQIENVLQTGRDKGMQSMEYSIQKALDSQLIDYTAAEILLKGD